MTLQIIRSDPMTAHGFAPGELLLGRPLVYPCEIKKSDIDFEGTKMTSHLVQKLNEIHNDSFGKAGEKIEAYQRKYKEKYDRKHKVKPFGMKKGDKVQIKRIRTKKAKGGKTEIVWFPRNSFYTLRKINKGRKSVLLYNPKTKCNLKSSFPFERVRRFTGQV